MNALCNGAMLKILGLLIDFFDISTNKKTLGNDIASFVPPALVLPMVYH